MERRGATKVAMQWVVRQAERCGVREKVQREIPWRRDAVNERSSTSSTEKSNYREEKNGVRRVCKT